MRSYLAAFALAMCLAAALTPLARRLAFRMGAVVRPGGRHVHKSTIPRMGGVAIAVAICAPLLALFVVDSAVARIIRNEAHLAVGLLVGGVLVCGVGVADDVRGLRPRYKLLAQIAASAIAYGFGFRIPAVHVPFVGALSMGVFALPVTILWIVGITNAVNLIDGLDGLAAGVVFFAAVTNFAVALISTSVFVAVLMAAVMGALLGFLFYNFNPARIFMGDSGSYFLGFVLATSSLAGPAHKASAAVSLLVPIVALGVPIFDTLFSMVRRMLERRPLFSPDRGHIHHRLLDMGITHRRAVLILYGVSVALTVAAIGISLGRQWETGIALVSATVVMVALVRFAGYFDYLNATTRQKGCSYDDQTERLRRALPSLICGLDGVRTHDDLWRELEHFAARSDFAGFEMGLAEGSGQRTAHRWDAAPREARDLITTEFLLARSPEACTVLRFAWARDAGDLSPQAGILLQLVADTSEQVLLRIGSALAPASDRPTAEAATPAPVTTGGTATLG